MRLIIYIAGAIALLVAASYFGQPIQTYLARIKADHNVTDRLTGKSDKHVKSVQTSLAEALALNPNVSHLYVAVIHTAILPDATQTLQFDIIAALSSPGHVTGPLPENLPLTNWSDFLRPLLARECAVVITASMANANEQKRLLDAHTAEFIACPVLNKKGLLLGAVSATWDKVENVPPNLSIITESLRSVAKTKAMDLNPNE